MTNKETVPKRTTIGHARNLAEAVAEGYVIKSEGRADTAFVITGKGRRIIDEKRKETRPTKN